MPHRETIRLWLFATPAMASAAPDLNRRYRWAHLFPVPRAERPPWTHALGADAWAVNEGSGEYQGCFGFPARDPEDVDGSRIERSLRAKHPEWSRAKLQRAARAAHAAGLRADNWGRPTLDAREILAFLKDIARFGPVTFVLDDGGLAPPEYGGTKGREIGAPGADSKHPAVVDLDAEALAAAFPLRYWAPVTLRG